MITEVGLVMVALETYNLVAQRIAIDLQLDVLLRRICREVSPEVRIDVGTLYKLPHVFSYRWLVTSHRVKLACFEALARADLPVLGRVFLLVSV